MYPRGKIRVFAPGPGRCPTCAGEHGPKERHDLNSLYYQYRFFRAHRRFPTAEDAQGKAKRGARPEGAEGGR